MTSQDFLERKSTKELLLFSIYDVDEFVLSEIEKIKSSNTIDIWDVSKATRLFFEINQISNENYQEDSISKEEYLLNKEQGFNNCFTRLNY